MIEQQNLERDRRHRRREYLRAPQTHPETIHEPDTATSHEQDNAPETINEQDTQTIHELDTAPETIHEQDTETIHEQEKPRGLLHYITSMMSGLFSNAPLNQ